jgi:hypothetical protein
MAHYQDRIVKSACRRFSISFMPLASSSTSILSLVSAPAPSSLPTRVVIGLEDDDCVRLKWLPSQRWTPKWLQISRGPVYL